jgi:hypothetical protein
VSQISPPYLEKYGMSIKNDLITYVYQCIYVNRFGAGLMIICLCFIKFFALTKHLLIDGFIYTYN